MMKILLAGNSPGIQGLAKLLKAKHPRVKIVTATDAEDAFTAIVVHQDFDGIVMDDQMDVSRWDAALQKATEQGKTAGQFVVQVSHMCLRGTAVILLSETLEEEPLSDYILVTPTTDTQDLINKLFELIEWKNKHDEDAYSDMPLRLVRPKPKAGRRIKPVVTIGLLFHEPDIADLIKETLNVFNVELIDYIDPVVALNEIDQKPPDLIFVVNFMMPRMDGYTFIRKVREKWGVEQLGIMAFHSFGNRVEIEKYIDPTMINEWVVKPFALDRLRLATRRLIENQLARKSREQHLAASAPSGAKASRYTIGLVWEDPNIAEIVECILRLKGYRVIRYGTSRNALAKMAEKLPDLLFLCNIMLKELDGYGLIKAVREKWTRDEVEAIAATVKGSTGEQMNDLFDLFGAIIVKPFDFDEFTDTVEKVLREREKRRAIK